MYNWRFPWLSLEGPSFTERGCAMRIIWLLSFHWTQKWILLRALYPESLQYIKSIRPSWYTRCNNNFLHHRVAMRQRLAVENFLEENLNQKIVYSIQTCTNIFIIIYLTTYFKNFLPKLTEFIINCKYTISSRFDLFPSLYNWCMNCIWMWNLWDSAWANSFLQIPNINSFLFLKYCPWPTSLRSIRSFLNLRSSYFDNESEQSNGLN